MKYSTKELREAGFQIAGGDLLVGQGKMRRSLGRVKDGSIDIDVEKLDESVRSQLPKRARPRRQRKQVPKDVILEQPNDAG